MSRATAISARHLGKRFKLYGRPHQRLLDWLLPRTAPRYQEFWALRDVSFDVTRGERVGIVGVNGAGKSTLLKVMTGTLDATVGDIAVSGRAVSLLELGSGFNPELTGRLNVEESARLLGFPPSYARDRMADIESFAELGEFFDRPVKMYSVGMFMRLGFALFTSMDPEIFLIDEALAVGDLRFAQKTVARVRGMVERGMTLVLVTHDLALINDLCTRALWIHSGTLQMDGPAMEVTRAYTQFVIHGYPASGSVAPAPPASRSPLADGSAASLSFGRGWHALEAYAGDVFRWASERAEVVVEPPPGCTHLFLDLAPGPTAEGSAAVISVRDHTGAHLAELAIPRRQTVGVPIPLSAGPNHITLWTRGALGDVPGEPRTLAFRAFRYGWSAEEAALEPIDGLPQQVAPEDREMELLMAHATMRAALARCPPASSSAVRIVRVLARDEQREEAVRFGTHASMTVEIGVEARADVDRLAVRLSIRDMFDRLIWRSGQDEHGDALIPALKRGQTARATYATSDLLLGSGAYQLSANCYRESRPDEVFQSVAGAWCFEVVGPAGRPSFGLADLGLRPSNG